MIMLTTFRGDRFALNPDLIEEIRAVGRGTSISLITGRSYSSAENIDEVQKKLVEFRVGILRAVEGDADIERAD